MGVVFYLGSYAALQFGFISGRGFTYPALNLIAASCVLLSLIEAYNLSSVLIQVFWILISIYGLTRLYILRHLVNFTVDEAAFLKHVFPDMEKEFAKPLVKMGKWENVMPGEILMEEGKPVENLVYLADGAANITLNNKLVANANNRSILGEITCLDGAPATATVTVSQPSRLMRIDAQKLRAKLKMQPELRNHLERSFKIGIAAKLSTATREVMLSKQ